MAPRSVLFGCQGTDLTPRETSFFRDADPWGFILFARNLETPEQIRRLTADLRNSVGRNAPILIDQEGGRVARLTPPHWTGWDDALPFTQQFPTMEARVEAMRLRYHIIATELLALGIDVNCAPLGDIAYPETCPPIRTRFYGEDPTTVATLARAVADGLVAGGVLPVMKHIPGHGRTALDSHLDLPRIDADRATLTATDFAPFKALSDLPMGMTNHLVYEAVDTQPTTWSAPMIDLIRTEIGFDGLLMTDDLSMHALTGDFGTRVTRALDAGCDMILHCNGDPAEMEPVAGAAPELAGRALARAEAALAARATAQPIDIPAALARIDALRQEVAHA